MSIHGLVLDGWDDLSTWGYDDLMGSFYAQLTRNGHSDDGGPDVWITPGPAWPAIHHPDVLAEVIAEATGATLADVRAAMDADPDAAADLPAWRPTGHGGPDRMTVHRFGGDLPGVWGYDPARRTFYARLRLAAGIRDVGSAEEPIGTIGELVDQLTDVTGASWNEVEAWMDTALGQEGYAPAFFEGWPTGRAYSPTAAGGHTSPGLEPADDSLTREDIEEARDHVRAYAKQLTDAAHAHAPRRADDNP